MTEHHDKRRAEVPSEAQITAYFEQVNPAPTTRFYERMAQQPWSAADESPDRGRVLFWTVANRWRAAAAALIIAFGLSFLTPQMQAMAQDMLRYFTRADADSFSFEFTLVDLGDFMTKTEADTASDDEALTYQFDGITLELDKDNSVSLEGFADYQQVPLEEAETRAGIDIKVPSELPDGYVLEGAYAVPDSRVISVNYRSSNTPLGMVLTATSTDAQAALTSGLAADVGASADIETVDLGTVTGEYVRGSWEAENSDFTELETGESYDVTSIWNPNSPVQTLRWEEDGIRYQVVSFEDGLTREALLTFVRSRE